ncbi:hypothetical protein [Bifidobacterium moukalabense]|jgi:hypothetical protein|uniref:Uncharacterized protein n=1 Tax=Bifidobacterium moukalabense DSM 27321 TaxID=1435051 RepID=W4NB12_9BIFI|nr:hypothetical protein [Bifidobacterium moukalabense]ETY72209.1 hypothetical protein BMOU_0223 [Bifidobacterium moukalabense DSM 27321]
MRSLEYVCAATGGRIGFEGPVYGETMTGLRGREWSYSVGGRGLSDIIRKARELTMNVKVNRSETSLDLMHTMFDADMHAGTPGRLVCDGEWEAQAWIPKTSIKSISPTMVEAELTIVLHDGQWRRMATTQRFSPLAAVTDETLDQPYDLPVDLSSPRLVMHVHNPSPTDSEFVCRVFGQATNPQFTVGANLYQLNDVIVPDGGYLTLTALNDRKSIVLTAPNGDRVDVFSSGMRGSGKGCGTYVFEPIPSGDSVLTWPGDYTLEFDVYEAQGAPPWSTSS